MGKRCEWHQRDCIRNYKLDSLQHVSTATHTLATGLEAAVEGNYDIVLLDVYLPDGNGLQAIDRLRSVPSKPQVIIITGQGDPDGAELAIRHGVPGATWKKTPLSRRSLSP